MHKPKKIQLCFQDEFERVELGRRSGMWEGGGREEAGDIVFIFKLRRCNMEISEKQ